MNPHSGWQGRRVWIVGASTGIGAAMCAQLLTAGARVAASARSEDALAELARGAPDRLLALPLDVREPAQLEQAAARLSREWQGLDLAIFAAGMYAPMRAPDFDLQAAKATLDTNLLGAFNFAHVALPLLESGRPDARGIAFIASVAGYRGLPRALAYGASKAGLINFCETLRLDLAPRGIDVHLICPGFVATPMTAVNDFAMPALLSVDDAARRSLDGIARGQFDIHFPRRFTAVLKLMRILPYSLYFALVRRFTGG